MPSFRACPIVCKREGAAGLRSASVAGAVSTGHPVERRAPLAAGWHHGCLISQNVADERYLFARLSWAQLRLVLHERTVLARPASTLFGRSRASGLSVMAN